MERLNSQEQSAERTNPLVMIVDDVPKNLQVLGNILRKEEYRIAAATSGHKALSMLEAMTPDIILLDIMMPEIDGFEVCRRINSAPETKNIPVIFLTAKTEPEDIVHGFELGAVDYLTKPFNSAELLARVHTHITLKNVQENQRKLNFKLKQALDDITELNRKLAKEMRDAREVQMAFLPKVLPEVKGWDIDGRSIPARQVGGDFFDLCPIDDQRTMIALGDVSGKGMPAALLMAECRSIFRTVAKSDLPFSPLKVIELTNRMISEDSDDAMFVTCFLGVIDNESGELTYCNAAHNPPLHFLSNKEEIVELSPSGTVIGFSTELQYEEKTTMISPGDMLIIYSDGISESRNANGDLYTDLSVNSFLSQNRTKTSSSILESLFNEVNLFTGECDQSDDRTVLVLKKDSSVN